MTDIDVSELSPAEYTRLMAEGLGDAVWADTPRGVSLRHYVESLNDVVPHWDPKLLEKVQAALTDFPDDAEAWALGDDDDLSTEDRAQADEAAADDLIRRLAANARAAS